MTTSVPDFGLLLSRFGSGSSMPRMQPLDRFRNRIGGKSAVHESIQSLLRMSPGKSVSRCFASFELKKPGMASKEIFQANHLLQEHVLSSRRCGCQSLMPVLTPIPPLPSLYPLTSSHDNDPKSKSVDRTRRYGNGCHDFWIDRAASSS